MGNRQNYQILKGKKFRFKNGTLGRTDYEVIVINNIKDVDHIGIKYLHEIEYIS